jgi:PAS domain S-box-containing protein
VYKSGSISKSAIPGWVGAAFDKLSQAVLVVNRKTSTIEYHNSVAEKEYKVSVGADLGFFLIKQLGIDPALSFRIVKRVQDGLIVQQGIENKHTPKEWLQLKIESLEADSGLSMIQLSDLSDSVKSEETLIKEIQKFEALFNFATMGILLVNEGGNIVMSNPYANKQFGYGAGEVLGQKIESLIPMRFREKHQDHRARYGVKPESRTMGTGLDLFAMRKDKTEFPVQISLGHFENEEGKFTLAFVIDDTDRKQKEKAIIQQKEEMAEANKRIQQLNEMLEFKVAERTRMLQDTMKELEESRDSLTQALEKEKQLNDMKSRFVSMASHEFRTPLSTILSSVTLLSKYITTEEQAKREKHIDRIKSSVTNLTDILNEFLSLGKIEDGKVEPRWTDFSIPDYVHTVIKQMETICKAGQKIIYNHKGNDLVELDPALLKNVFINLISNAIKFSPEQKPIHVATKVNEKGLEITIKDEGLGISREDQQHLFERFFRGNNVTNIQGTGLGLHIVSRYVQLMNGTINCKSELEEGTEFIIFFPRREKEQQE